MFPPLPIRPIQLSGGLINWVWRRRSGARINIISIYNNNKSDWTFLHRKRLTGLWGRRGKRGRCARYGTSWLRKVELSTFWGRWMLKNEWTGRDSQHPLPAYQPFSEFPRIKPRSTYVLTTKWEFLKRIFSCRWTDVLHLHLTSSGCAANPLPQTP